MSEQISGTHGPAEDDAIKRQDRRDLETYGEELPEPESPDEDEPEATWAEEGRFAGMPPGEDWEAVNLRSDLARQLDRTAFPATRAHLLEILSGNLADQRLLNLVSSLPDDARFSNLAELLQALGLPMEHRPA
jgi:hypothetical protein